MIMTEESPFEKLHIEPEAKGKLTGLLEQLNLPPKGVKFIRENLKIINTVLVITIVVAVFWSMYDSYRYKRINDGGSALSIALSEPESARPAALQKVLSDFSDTPSGRWAQVELAHIDMKGGNFSAAAQKYSAVREKLKPNDPLFGLVSLGVAQAREAAKEYDQAFGEYTTLSKIEGYQPLCYLGIGRIHEIKGERDKALSSYEQYIATFVGQNGNNPEKTLISEKIGRLKAML
jgi:predicted negative regulator of RcsB-dependent stress response